MRWSLCLLAGCLAEPDNTVAIQGRHVTVHVEPTIPVCAAAVAVADRFVEDTAAMLGIPPPAIDYYLFDGPTGCDFRQYTNSSCTVGTAVYANAWIHFHELAHAVDDSVPPALFVEGFAQALSRPSRDVRGDSLVRADARLDFDSSVFRAADPAEEYHVAGDFVRFVIERFGAERYRTFARSVSYLADPLTTRRAFAQAFGATLDDVIASWRESSPASSTLRVPVDDADCQDPIPPVAPDTWELHDVLADGCLTGTTASGAVFVQPSGRHGFEVTTPGLYVVEATGDPGTAKGHVRSCAGDVQYEFATSGSARRFLIADLPAGRHSIELAGGLAACRIALVGDPGQTCETAPAFTAPAGEPWQLALHGTRGTWLRIEYDGSRPLYARSDGLSATRACWGTCSNLQCVPMAHGRLIGEVQRQPLYLVLGQTTDASETLMIETVGEEDPLAER